MKNEGPFITEWVAHYLSIGFNRIFVITNDCDDGTDLIADRLSALAPVTHIRNLVPEGEFAQVTGMQTLKLSGHLIGVDWLLHCDADEFLYLHTFDPDIENFISALPPCDAVAFDWRYVGTNIKKWAGGLVVEQCLKGSASLSKAETFSKTMFRPALFNEISDHMPKAPVHPKVVVRNSVGQELPNTAMFHPRKSRYIRDSIDHYSWNAAEMRHYALRADDVFSIKALRGFGINPRPQKYRVGSAFWKSANKCERILDVNPIWLKKLKSRFECFLEDKELMRLHMDAIDKVQAKAQQLRKME